MRASRGNRSPLSFSIRTKEKRFRSHKLGGSGVSVTWATTTCVKKKRALFFTLKPRSALYTLILSSGFNQFNSAAPVYGNNCSKRDANQFKSWEKSTVGTHEREKQGNRCPCFELVSARRILSPSQKFERCPLLETTENGASIFSRLGVGVSMRASGRFSSPFFLLLWGISNDQLQRGVHGEWDAGQKTMNSACFLCTHARKKRDSR